jgi:hypothetical protein
MIFRTIGHWKTMGKKLKLVSRVDLRHSQSNSSTMMDTMKGDLPGMIWNLVQANHQYGNPGVD